MGKWDFLVALFKKTRQRLEYSTTHIEPNMKLTFRFAITAFFLAGFCSLGLAQDLKPADKLVDFKDVKVQVQKTPDFTLKGGTTAKPSRQKDWIEIEAEFKTERPKGPDSKADVIGELTFNYYVFLNSSVKEHARVLTAQVVHSNVPIDEISRSVVYISPSTIRRITGRPEGNVSLVSMYAVEVTMGGTTVGFFTKGAAKGKWWDAAGAPAKEPALMAKSKTPFAPLWGDYHADEQAK